MRPQRRRAHAGQHRLGAQERRLEVDGDGAVEFGLGEIVEPAPQGDAGIVDQHVGPAQLARDALQHGRDGGAVGDIGAHGRRPPAELADRLRDGVGFRRARRVVHGHVGAGFSESERNSPADAARAAGDQGDAAGEVGGEWA